MKFLLSTIALGAAATAPALDLTGSSQDAPTAPPVIVSVAGQTVAVAPAPLPLLPPAPAAPTAQPAAQPATLGYPIAVAAPLAPVASIGVAQDDDELAEEAKRLEAEVAELRKQLEKMRGELGGATDGVQRIRILGNEKRSAESKKRAERSKARAEESKARAEKSKERAEKSKERAQLRILQSKERAASRSAEARGRAESRAAESRGRAESAKKRALALVKRQNVDAKMGIADAKKQYEIAISAVKAAEGAEKANDRIVKLRAAVKGKANGRADRETVKRWVTNVEEVVEGQHNGDQDTFTFEASGDGHDGEHMIFVQERKDNETKTRSFKGADGSTFNIHVEDGDVHIYTGGAKASTGMWSSKAPTVLKGAKNIFSLDGKPEVRVKTMWSTDGGDQDRFFLGGESKNEEHDHDHDHDGDHDHDHEGDDEHENNERFVFRHSFGDNDSNVQFGLNGMIEVNGEKIDLSDVPEIAKLGDAFFEVGGTIEGLKGLEDMLIEFDIPNVENFEGTILSEIQEGLSGINVEGFDLGELDLDGFNFEEMDFDDVDVQVFGLGGGDSGAFEGKVKNHFVFKSDDGEDIESIVKGKVLEHVGGSLRVLGDAEVLLKIVGEDGNVKELTGDAAKEFMKDGKGLDALLKSGAKSFYFKTDGDVEIREEECEEDEAGESSERGDSVVRSGVVRGGVVRGGVVRGSHFPHVIGTHLPTSHAQRTGVHSFPTVKGTKHSIVAGAQAADDELLQIAKDIQTQVNEMRKELDALRREVLGSDGRDM